MHKGKRYRVSCDELGVQRTKEDSYQAANHWWRVKLASLSILTIDPERQEAVSDLERKLKYAVNHAPDLVQELKLAKAEIESASPAEQVLADGQVIEENLRIANLMGVVVPDDLDPVVLQHLFGDRRIWNERLKRAGHVEHDKTVGHNLSKFLEEQKTQQNPATHNEIAKYLSRLTNESPVWSKETDVSSIQEKTVTDHYLWLASQKYETGAHNKRLGFFRRFVTWLWDEKLLEELPRNLRRKSHRKKKVHKEVKRFDGVSKVIESLLPRFRLWALLGLNCGMTSTDLGTLFWHDDKLSIGDKFKAGGELIEVCGLVCTENWTIRRRRAKTGDNESTPTVTYRLWDETVQLLKGLKNHSGLVFCTKHGTPLYVTKYKENGDAAFKDLFTSYWNKQTTKPPITLGKFRSIAATTLKSDKVMRQYEDYFLAHTPKTIADQHYGAEWDDPFFEALEFIYNKVFGAS